MTKEKAVRSLRLRAASEENKIDDDPTVPGCRQDEGSKGETKRGERKGGAAELLLVRYWSFFSTSR